MSISTHIKTSVPGRLRIERIATRMGWSFGDTVAAAAILAENASDAALLEARRKADAEPDEAPRPREAG